MLLVFAVLIVLLAYASVGIAMDDEPPPSLVSYGVGLIVLVGAVHVTLRLRAKYADPVMLPIATVLNGLGLVMIHRLDRAHERSGGGAFAFRQAIWMTIGVALCLLILWLLGDHRRLQRFTYIAMAGGLVLLLLPLAPGIGKNINGSRIWIGLGPLSFQPGEPGQDPARGVLRRLPGADPRRPLARRTPVRRLLAAPRPRPGPDPRRLAGEPGRAGVRARPRVVAAVLRAVRRAALRGDRAHQAWIAIGLLLFVGGAYVAYLLFGHVQTRVLLWLHPFSQKALETSDQIVRGLFGMANGGLLGTGLGQGRPDLNYYAESDLIFPSFGEEIGLIGVFALLLLYLLLVERGLRTGLGVRDGFGKPAGHRAVVHLRAAVLRGHRRRHPGDPADRPDDPVPLVRRLVAGRELGDPRAAAADQRPGPPSGAAARPGRRPRRRCRDPGGEGAVNTPIRRVAAVVLVLFGTLLLSSTYIQFVQASSLPRQAAEPAHPAGELRPRARADHRGRHPDRPLEGDRRPACGTCGSTPATPRLYSHLTGYYSFVYGAGDGVERGENSLLAGSSDQALLPPHGRPGDGPRAAGRERRA
ncbi:hypothetical protein GCM10025868_22830 [Angustibacter aerolatus]|uniref:Penicillin binding protein A dimerisation domain-containing protein n=1 Tax=Angustibacter aerolatus TaxID=1162965 RepID=A0ABQ6JI20_9ACTN|nr:hypothetical protein GCM10025868_22830 [Angustibacter aerolatus]